MPSETQHTVSTDSKFLGASLIFLQNEKPSAEFLHFPPETHCKSGEM